MDNWRWEDSTGTEALALMAVAFCFNDFFKAVIGPRLEQALGWKPTDWDWQLYWWESVRKAQFEENHKAYQEWLARNHARGVIHDFVWSNP